MKLLTLFLLINPPTLPPLKEVPFDIGWGLTKESIDWVNKNHGPIDLRPIREVHPWYSKIYGER